MELNGKEFEITNVEKFFLVMDTFKKEILSNNIQETGVPKNDKYTIYVVSDHALGLPLEAPEKLAPYMRYL